MLSTGNTFCREVEHIRHKLEDNRTKLMNGVLVVNKDKGMTSHDVVRRVRALAKQRDVGHLGTLDPMATGVLPLVLGKMTRIAQFYDHAEKRYEGSIRFGISTDTYDAEGQPSSEAVEVTFSRLDLEMAMSAFRGEIDQVPPPFSAKKIDGIPAYKLARKNESVPLKPVKITVSRFEVLSYQIEQDSPQMRRWITEETCPASAVLTFRADVSSGSYIRSLAHDLGRKLGTGAHLESLCRTQAAEFTLPKAHRLADLQTMAANGTLEEALVPPTSLLPAMPGVHATDEQLIKIRHGNAVNLAEFTPAEMVKVFYGQGEMAAIVRRVAGTLFQPKIVLIQ